MKQSIELPENWNLSLSIDYLEVLFTKVGREKKLSSAYGCPKLAKFQSSLAPKGSPGEQNCSSQTHLKIRLYTYLGGFE